MKVVSISDYAIKHRIGKSISTDVSYVTRKGTMSKKTVFKEFYKTNLGEFLSNQWLEMLMEFINTVGENKLLEEIKKHVKPHCVWLKTQEEVDEYSIQCLASGAYMYWEGFQDKRIPTHKVFIFERSDLL